MMKRNVDNVFSFQKRKIDEQTHVLHSHLAKRCLCCSIEQTHVLQQGVVAHPAPSSSNLISFELSNGDPYCPSVLASIDDDEYVEYSLDNLTDFTESMEDENKVCTYCTFLLHAIQRWQCRCTPLALLTFSCQKLSDDHGSSKGVIEGLGNGTFSC